MGWRTPHTEGRDSAVPQKASTSAQNNNYCSLLSLSWLLLNVAFKKKSPLDWLHFSIRFTFGLEREGAGETAGAVAEVRVRSAGSLSQVTGRWQHASPPPAPPPVRLSYRLSATGPINPIVPGPPIISSLFQTLADGPPCHCRSISIN